MLCFCLASLCGVASPWNVLHAPGPFHRADFYWQVSARMALLSGSLPCAPFQGCVRCPPLCSYNPRMSPSIALITSCVPTVLGLVCHPPLGPGLGALPPQLPAPSTLPGTERASSTNLLSELEAGQVSGHSGWGLGRSGAFSTLAY